MPINELSVVQVLTLGSPGIAFIFALSFVGVAKVSPHAGYLRYVGLSFALFGLAAIGQIMHIPSGFDLNAVLTGALYVGCALALSHGLLRRNGKRLDPYTIIAAFVLIVGGLWYYSYVDYDLRTRVYILNFGCAFVLVRTWVQLGELRRGKVVDRWLYWVFLVFSLSFFLRTGLTLTPDIGAGPAPSFGLSRFWIALQLSMLLFSAFLAVLLIIAAMTDWIGALENERSHDVLTGLLNRRGLGAFLASDRRRVHDLPLSVVAMDVDHFKSINDTFGHRVGDEVLRQLGRLVLSDLRRQDAAARVGGEEFIIVLPGTHNASARCFSERLRARIEAFEMDEVPQACRVTASFGVATSQEGEQFSDLLDRADRLLYKAKRNGRNRVINDEIC